MRPPRFRLRTLLIVVALVALALVPATLARRRQRFEALAHHHREAAGGPFAVSLISPAGRAHLYELAFRAGLLSPERRQWHRDLTVKYERAARYPWLLVAPDPPPPE